MPRGGEHLITQNNYYETGLAESKANFARMFRTHSDTSSIMSIAVKTFILYNYQEIELCAVYFFLSPDN